MGVPYNEPKTPPLDLHYNEDWVRFEKDPEPYIVNVPPAISSSVNFPSRA